MIIREGDDGDCMFIVDDGRVQVSKIDPEGVRPKGRRAEGRHAHVERVPPHHSITGQITKGGESLCAFSLWNSFLS